MTSTPMADNRVRPEGEAMAQLDNTTVEGGLQHLPGWERRNENLALASLAEGGLPACDLQLAGRIQELDQPARPA
jgi:hypothetical protein